MNKLLALLALSLLLPLMGNAQDRDLLRLFEKYQDVQGFEYEMGDASLNVDTDWNFGEFLDRLEAFYILGFDKNTGDPDDLLSFENKFYKLIGKKDFVTVLELESDGKIQLFMREDSNGKPADYILVAGGDNDISFIWAAGK